jgi:hypothetical protein
MAIEHTLANCKGACDETCLHLGMAISRIKKGKEPDWRDLIEQFTWLQNMMTETVKAISEGKR